MTSMRDAKVSGAALRESHRRVGQYLATEFLSQIIGIEAFPIQYVQGELTDGYRLRDEKKTVIVPLMRGGEPIAFGISDILPLESFVHAKIPEDINEKFLKDYSMIVLVGSVVSSGNSVVEFEDYIRNVNPMIQIVVIAGVVQQDTVVKDSLIWNVKRKMELNIIALRLSERKYTGKD